ncbi:hypothetical protein CMI47_04485 [Candidatus Pacearchaeota archaeon]|jgi:hypothetical protein|nr:hypothetical protein [Candidatus Pacearchaeota archaeon]
MSKEQLPQHMADLGAVVSTAAVVTYSFTDILHGAALVVAIVSGSLAAAWHTYKFYLEYRNRGNDASNADK